MKTFVTFVSLCLLVSCASKEVKETMSPFNPITLKEKLVKGKTTQNQVLETFGAPDMVTEGSEEADTWVYSKNSDEWDDKGMSAGVSAMLPVGAKFIPYVGDYVHSYVGKDKGNSTHSSKSVNVYLSFDKQKVLQDYRIVRSTF